MLYSRAKELNLLLMSADGHKREKEHVQKFWKTDFTEHDSMAAGQYFQLDQKIWQYLVVGVSFSILRTSNFSCADRLWWPDHKGKSCFANRRKFKCGVWHKLHDDRDVSLFVIPGAKASQRNTRTASGKEHYPGARN